MKKIAIIGATGMLGQPVTRAFIKAGYAVRLLVRNEEKARAIFGNQAELLRGDLADEASLRKLLEGADWLYLNLAADQSSRESDFQPEREGLKNVLRLASEAGIKRVGYISSLVKSFDGISWWVLDMKRHSVELIRNSGLTYSLFYPSTFMESFDKGAYRQGNKLNLAGKSLYPMYLIAGEDYGRMVVRAFELENGNQEYNVQGEEAWTIEEAAKQFVEKYKKTPLKIVKLPFGILRFLSLFSQKFNYVANIVYALNHYPEKFESEKTWEELGRPEIKLEDYIRNA